MQFILINLPSLPFERHSVTFEPPERAYVGKDTHEAGTVAVATAFGLKLVGDICDCTI
jgi:hypothetical protein